MGITKGGRLREEHLLRRFLNIMRDEGVLELEIRGWRRYIRIVRGHRRPEPTSPEPEEEPREAHELEDKLYTIKAPMVGTFYRAPAPDAEPFVREGDRVQVGQTVCLIEAMKIMNEIESDVAGTILEVLVEDAQPVEYGQELFSVKLD
ncbi:MAG: acetyl-CoA carboxylase, biotin carboxyl carrier protein [Candidatus Hydrothermota bacterium]|nr:MAG: acetyl-CoA carboxylase, biotin carboxyl carrier protein [Candidatus Hydrothermae bacterium]